MDNIDALQCCHWNVHVKQCLNSYMLKLNHPKGTWSHMENSIDYQSSLPVRKSYGTHNGEQIRHDKKSESESEMARPGDIGTEIFAAWPAWWIRHERNRDGICDHLQVLPLAQHTLYTMNTHKCGHHCLFSFKNGSSSLTGGRECLIWVLLEGKSTDAKKIREIAIWRSLHHRVVHKQLLECHEVWKRSHIELQRKILNMLIVSKQYVVWVNHGTKETNWQTVDMSTHCFSRCDWYHERI